METTKLQIAPELKKLPTIKVKDIHNLQKSLKDLTEQNYKKLLTRLQEHGFKYPMYLWKNPEDGLFYNLDGNQRQRVITKHWGEGAEVPYITISAATETEAKKEILAISSQYGIVTKDGFDEFSADFTEIDLAEVADTMVWDRMLDANEILFIESAESLSDTNKQSIILEYTDYEYDAVMNALKKHKGTKEQIFYTLLGLREVSS
jgi:hypothetical protein